MTNKPLDIGCDIISINRIRKAFKAHGDKFTSRILTPEELGIFTERNCNVQFLAGRFAAKEAIAKSYRSGIGATISFLDISILPDDNGAPIVYIKGNADESIRISISHCTDYAMAMCVKINS